MRPLLKYLLEQGSLSFDDRGILLSVVCRLMAVVSNRGAARHTNAAIFGCRFWLHSRKI